MTLVKRNPANINYLFDELINGFPTTWGKDAQNNGSLPATNIYETKDGYDIELNAPGRNKDGFKINVENGLLTISFEQKTETDTTEAKVLRREFNYQSFKRSFSLDEKIDLENIKAKYENGVLKLHLPKKEEVKVLAKSIEIQ